MKNLFFIVVFFAVSLLPGCNLISGIFKAGAYTGIFVFIVVIALIVLLISKFRSKDYYDLISIISFFLLLRILFGIASIISFSSITMSFRFRKFLCVTKLISRLGSGDLKYLT